MTNCVLWDGGDEIWNKDGSTVTITYTDVQGGHPGTGNIDADPLFVDPECGPSRVRFGGETGQDKNTRHSYGRRHEKSQQPRTAGR